MAGDVEEAKELLLSYHSVWKRYGFLPELFDIPSNKPFGRQSVYPLRPGMCSCVILFFFCRN